MTKLGTLSNSRKSAFRNLVPSSYNSRHRKRMEEAPSRPDGPPFAKGAALNHRKSTSPSRLPSVLNDKIQVCNSSASCEGCYDSLTKLVIDSF